MTRYHFDAAWSGQQLHENDCLVPWDKGEWVRFKDAQADKAKLVEALEDMVTQFAYGNAVGQLHTGGLSSLEHAFNVFGWDDPRDAGKEMLCDEPGCKKFISCGTPTASGYRNVCSEHYAVLKEVNP